MINFFDTQHDSEYDLDSFVIGRQSTKADLGRLVFAENLVLQSDIFIEWDVELLQLLINANWLDTLTDNDGNVL